jgi:hypothetical protein
MLVVFTLFAVVTPFVTVFLLWRQYKLRQQLLKLTELSMEVSDGLRRDLLELKRQVEATAGAPQIATDTPLAKHAAPEHVEKALAPAAPVVQKPAASPVVSSPSFAPVSNAVEKVAEFIASRQKQEAAPPVVVPPVPPKAEQPVIEKPAAAVLVPRKAEEKPAAHPVVPPPAAATPEHKPPTPVTPTPGVPAHKPAPFSPPAAATPPLPSHGPVTPPKTPSTPATSPAAHPVVPPAAARVVEPPQYAAFRSSAPTTPRPTASASSPTARRTSQQRMKSVFAFEELLGTNWLNKIGIVLVVIGVASFGIYELGQLGPLFRVAVSYAVGAAFLGSGNFLEKRDRYRIFSYPLIGGGWALIFFTTYAMNHVPLMRLTSADGATLISETFDLILMLAVALAMVVHTLRYRSQVVTGIAFLLAFTTVALSHDDVYSLSSGVILAIGLVAIVIRMGWFELEVFGILSSFGNHIYWLYRVLGAGGAQGHAFPEFHASTAILLFYWITYRFSYVVRKIKTPTEEHVSTAAALLNTLLLLGAMKFQSVRPELAFMALLIIGAAEFTFAQLPIIRRRREAFVVLSVLGAALMIGAFPFKYSGNHLAILWLVGAEVFLIAGVMFSEVVFRRVGLLTGLLVAVHLVLIDFQELLVRRRVNDNLVLDLGVMFALCAAVFYLNLLFVGWRWRPFFDDAPDEQLLIAHSYVGGFAAACAAWALCSGDWTAMAFAGIMLTLAVLGTRLNSFHLQVQFGAFGLLSLFRVAVVNLHSDIPQYTHVTNRLITLPIIAAAFYITAKFAATKEDNNQQTLRWLFAFSGTALLTALIYYEVPELWQPLAAIAFAVALLEIGQWIGYPALAWHAHLLSALAILAALTADAASVQRWHDIPVHAFAALPVVAGVYWNARRIRAADAAHVSLARILYTWSGTGVMAWVLYEATPEPWIAVSWIAFAIALALVMRRIGYQQLAWQANAVAACAAVRSFTFNLDLGRPLWTGFSLRLVTIAIVAAGLYFLSRKATIPESESRRLVSYLHTFAATALLTVLAWREAPNGWLATVWAVFALVLALVDRRFELEDLRWQAHALAALTMLRSIGVNLYVLDTWHGISIRLLSLSIVAVIFYALSRVIRMPESLRERDFHHIYSWAASTLVSLLMWYELKPVSVAVGWTVFGLVLFEYGLWRKTRQFRFQAYVALAASFGRIFFANLTADTPGEFWGPRMYTVLPIALILFFVYAQLGDEDARDDRAIHFDALLAYLGTGTVVALLYFQFANEWIVTTWGIVVFVLFGVSLFLNRPIFLYQALLLTVGTCTRGVMHNLFGASYFTGQEWTGRFFVLGSAIAALLACLPFAFRWRDRMKTKPSGNWMVAIVRRPEQFMFFAPVLLLTLMLAVKMRSGMITVSWGVEALGILIFAFVINERSYRLTGLFLLLVSFAKILLVDMWWGAWTWRDRYVTWIIVGAAMVLAGLLYTKYHEKIRQLL